MELLNVLLARLGTSNNIRDTSRWKRIYLVTWFEICARIEFSNWPFPWYIQFASKLVIDKSYYRNISYHRKSFLGNKAETRFPLRKSPMMTITRTRNTDWDIRSLVTTRRSKLRRTKTHLQWKLGHPQHHIGDRNLERDHQDHFAKTEFEIEVRRMKRIPISAVTLLGMEICQMLLHLDWIYWSLGRANTRLQMRIWGKPPEWEREYN